MPPTTETALLDRRLDRRLGHRYPLPGYKAELFGSAGEPRCLLLHGFTGTGVDWAHWRPDMPSALAIDLPGHGGSPQPAGSFSSEVARLLAALPPSIDCLIGYSLGGRIGLSLLAAAPARFRSAIILSAHPGLVDAAHRSARRTADRHWIELLRERGIAAFTAVWEQQPLFASQRQLPASLLDAQRRRRLAQDAEGLARSLEVFGLAEMPATWDALTRWRGRLDWIVGGEDARFRTIAEQVLARRPDTRVHLLPGIGHNPLLEAPEPLYALLQSLLTAMPSPAYQYRFTVALPDTDAAGVLFFAHLFRHAHDAYEAWMSSLGFPLHAMIRNGAVALPLVHAEADYSRALRHGDLVTVELSPAEVHPSRFTIGYRFLTNGATAATASSIHVCIDASMQQDIEDGGRRVRNLPKALLDALRAQLPTGQSTIR